MPKYYFCKDYEVIISKTEREQKHGRRNDCDFDYLGEYKNKKAAELDYVAKHYPEAVCMTEDMLVDHYVGVSNGYDYISDFDGRRYWWRYSSAYGCHRYGIESESFIIFTRWDVPLMEKYEVPTSEAADRDKVDKMVEDLERAILSTVGKDK